MGKGYHTTSLLFVFLVPDEEEKEFTKVSGL